MDLTQFSYYDRRTGALKRNPIYAPGLVDWLYNSFPGWWLTEVVLSRRWVSRSYSWWNKQSWSRRKIKSFARHLKVNLEDLSTLIEVFRSFNDFITREIDLSRRPIDPDPDCSGKRGALQGEA